MISLKSLFFIVILTIPQISNAQLEQTLKHDGIERKYLIESVSNKTFSDKIPLVLNLHGGGGNASQQRSSSKLYTLAKKEGFLLVHPEGYSRMPFGPVMATWNAGRCCGAAQKKNIDDVGFISKLIDTLIEHQNVDSNRIYVTGFSNGGMMAYRLACELSRKIAAIAPVGAPEADRPCNPQRAVPILDIHGALDPCAKYDGGECGGCFQRMMKRRLGFSFGDSSTQCKAIPEVMNTWAIRNKLSDRRKTITPSEFSSCVVYGEGEKGELVSCRVANLGHSWPGVGVYGRQCAKSEQSSGCQERIKVLGPFNLDFDANSLIWQFFKTKVLL